MKKIKYILLSIVIFMMPLLVLARGSISVSTSSLSIKKGNTASFKITASNAAGRVDISSSDRSVATVNSSSEWVENGSVTIKVTAKDTGTAKITVRVVDGATFDEEDLSGKTYTVNVSVTNSSSGGGGNSGGGGSGGTTKSKNTNLSSVKVEGYTVTKSGDVYKVTVPYSVTSVKVSATPSNDEAKVTGTGTKELQVGENTVNLVVTAVAGNKDTHKLIITRKPDIYHLEDIDEFVKNDKEVLLIRPGETLSEEIINKLKSLGKKITLSKLDNAGNVVYSYDIDTNQLSNNTNIDISNASTHDINELTNYSSGFSVIIDNSIPEGSTLSLNIKDQYVDGKIYVYKYTNDNKLELVKQVDIIEGNISFEILDNREYFISKSDLSRLNSGIPQVLPTSKRSPLWMIAAIIEAILLLGIILIVYLLLKDIKNKFVPKPLNVISQGAKVAEPIAQAAPNVSKKLDTTKSGASNAVPVTKAPANAIPASNVAPTTAKTAPAVAPVVTKPKEEIDSTTTPVITASKPVVETLEIENNEPVITSSKPVDTKEELALEAPVITSSEPVEENKETDKPVITSSKPVKNTKKNKKKAKVPVKRPKLNINTIDIDTKIVVTKPVKSTKTKNTKKSSKNTKSSTKPKKVEKFVVKSLDDISNNNKNKVTVKPLSNISNKKLPKEKDYEVEELSLPVSEVVNTSSKSIGSAKEEELKPNKGFENLYKDKD